MKKTQNNQDRLSRRRFLQYGLGLSTALFIPEVFAKIVPQTERKLALYNIHTGESLTATYWAEGQYQTDELQAINHVLRDFRTGDIHDIDPHLIDLLNLLHHKVHGKYPFHVISGYRSPKTNAALRHKSSGVAKHSLHMQGKAIDVRLPHRQLATLHKAAQSLKLGGVGYYSKSNFIHLDTGRVRYWGY